MRILVTGGAGFIGSHLCERLLKEGHFVICLDNFITGRLSNISHLRNSKKFKLINHDVSLPIKISGKIDQIFHLASPASPVEYLRYPIQTLKVGSLGTHNALGLARKKKAVFLLASTSEVYGDPQVHPQPETYWGHVNPVGPRGVYDEAKRFAEAITMAYHRAHNLDTKIARIFNTYGPRMKADDGRVVPAFISQALKKTPLTVFGDGSQTRSFCYVDDLVDGLIRLMNSKLNDPVNLGNPEEHTILEFAKIILSYMNSSSKIVFRLLPVDDPKQRRPNIARARQYLNWSPKVSLEDGLKKTIDWFKANA